MNETRMSFRANVVIRLIGLFIFIAPERGARFLAGLVPDVNAKARARKWGAA